MADKDKNGQLDYFELKELLKQFPNNSGLKMLDQLYAKASRRDSIQIQKKTETINLTKIQGAELFYEFYRNRKNQK